MWFLSVLAPDSLAYHVGIPLRITSCVDSGALDRALQTLVHRHEALRATFSRADEQPLQTIHSQQAVRLEVVDASACSQAELHSWVLSAHQRPFDLERGPLLRAVLFTCSARQHVLLICGHHIGLDGWSLGVLLRELRSLYAAEVTATRAELPASVPYSRLVAWEAEMLSSPAGRQHRDYWHQQLARPLPVLDLPTDRPRPLVKRTRGANCPFEVDPQVVLGLKQLARAQRATLGCIVAAAIQILLHRYSRQDDIVLGVVSVGRSHTEFKRGIGYFINPLALRANSSGNPRTKDFVVQVRDTMRQAQAHQDYPFPLLVSELLPQRDPSRSPLFDVAFNFQKLRQFESSAAASDADLAIAVLETLVLPQGEGQFDLVFDCYARSDGLVCVLKYDTDLFDAPTVERMRDHFCTLLEGMAADPDCRIEQLPLLDAADLQLMVSQQQEANGCADHGTLAFHEMVAEQARRTPRAPAVDGSGVQLSYAELEAGANRLARQLRSLGVGPEVIVGVCLPRSADLIVAFLAVLKAGGAYLPLDPAYPSGRLGYMLADAAPGVLVTRSSLLDRLPRPLPATLLIDQPLPPDVVSSVSPFLGHHPDPHALAYVIYTSGSTGRPKGVAVEHQGLANVVAEQVRLLALQPSERVLQFSSISFDACIFELLALAVGATMCIGHHDELLPGPALTEFLRREAVTRVTLPPSALANLVPTDLPDLRTITVAGEACSPNLVQQWAPGRRFFNLYGPTEATIWATAAECRADGQPRVPIGRPIGNIQAYVLSAHLRPVPIGVAGELCLGGVGLARGYLNQPELTAQRFIDQPLPGLPAQRLYRTGDLVRYRADGQLEFLGRLDNQLKIRGHRIEPGEIEAALNQHPNVRESAVVGLPTASGECQLVGYVTQLARPAASSPELRRHLATVLPDYMLPSRLVQLDALPLTASGKLDRDALAARAPDAQLGSDFVAPRTPAERTIAAIWQDLLGITRVGVRDNFFDLGGHSLLLVQVHTALRQAFGTQMSIAQLFESPTIETLARQIQHQPHTLPARVRGAQDRAHRRREALDLRRRAAADRRLRRGPVSDTAEA